MYVGLGAGSVNKPGEYNTYIGQYAGTFSSGSHNVFTGDQAGLTEHGKGAAVSGRSEPLEPEGI